MIVFGVGLGARHSADGIHETQKQSPNEISRREFIRGGVSAFTFSFAAPAFLSDLARAQGTARRNLVVLYLSGGNDALSMVIPYTTTRSTTRGAPCWGSRRPTSFRSARTRRATRSASIRG